MPTMHELRDPFTVSDTVADQINRLRNEAEAQAHLDAQPLRGDRIPANAADVLNRILGAAASEVGLVFTNLHETDNAWVSVYKAELTSTKLRRGFKLFVVTKSEKASGAPRAPRPLADYGHMVVVPSWWRRLASMNKVRSGFPLTPHSFENANRNWGHYYSDLKYMVKYFA
jgi:hypothetical protein